MTMITTEGLGYVTADSPGIGGVLKERPEDFIVTEEPLYEPCGEGDHLYLFVEKEKRLTTDVVRYFAKHFGVGWSSIGYAGLKDKHAITRQWFSIEHVDAEKAAGFEDEHIRILGVDRHTNKIKRGHLRGNRFNIKVRDVDPASVVRAKQMLDHLVANGAPNFIGPQRFGYRKDNHLLGRMMLLGDFKGVCDRMLGMPVDWERDLLREARQSYEDGAYGDAIRLWPTVHRFERQAVGPLSRGATWEQAVNAIDRPHRQLMVSAFQSAIFNRVVDNRLRAGLLATVLEGDLAFRHPTRGVFEVRDAEKEQPRCGTLEISPTGPMWGKEMQRPSGQIAEWERAAFDEADIAEADMFASKLCPDGSRKAMRITISDTSVSSGVDEHGEYVQCNFMLPRGCFATTIMRELMKDDPAE